MVNPFLFAFFFKILISILWLNVGHVCIIFLFVLTSFSLIFFKFVISLPDSLDVNYFSFFIFIIFISFTLLI